jgi:hypothetical protein
MQTEVWRCLSSFLFPPPSSVLPPPSPRLCYLEPEICRSLKPGFCCSRRRGKKYQKAKSRAYTEEMILARQKRLEEAGQDVKDTSLKFKLESLLQRAQEKGDVEAAAEVQAKIDKVNDAIAAQKARNADEKTHFWAKINARNKAKMLDAKFRASMNDLGKVTDGRLRTKDDNYWTVEKMKTPAELAELAAKEKADAEAKKAAGTYPGLTSVFLVLSEHSDACRAVPPLPLLAED